VRVVKAVSKSSLIGVRIKHSHAPLLSSASSSTATLTPPLAHRQHWGEDSVATVNLVASISPASSTALSLHGPTAWTTSRGMRTRDLRVPANPFCGRAVRRPVDGHGRRFASPNSQVSS
jgi:hypothetical protein